MTSVFQEMWPILHGLGFRLQWKIKNEGYSTRQYYRTEPDGREVTVQIDEDGRHRASHSFNGCSTIYDKNGNDTILPTEFTDAVGLVLAIEHEATRTDMRRQFK